MEVFLLLGVIWAAVLVPQWLENRRVARPTASIASFNRRLWSLERMTPVYDDSAYGSTYGDAPLAPGRRASAARARAAGTGRPGATHGGRFDGHLDGRFEGHLDGRFQGWVDGVGAVNGVGAANAVGAVNGVAVAAGVGAAGGPGGHGPVEEMIVFDDLRDDAGVLAATGARPTGRTSPSTPVTPLEAARSRPRHPAGWPAGRAGSGGPFDAAGAPPDARPGVRPAGEAEPLSPATVRARRRAAVMRRRRIVSTLLLLALVTAVVATPLGQPWWVVHGVADGLVVVYLALLVRRRRRLAEQARKVHYLSTLRAPRPGVVVYGSTGTGH